VVISCNGIVLNQYSDVLLVQRDDTRTLAPPGGACEIDELPGDAAVREVREETGLSVYPTRLVGLYFLPTGWQDFLFLNFRCIPGRGELAPSDETLQAGYFATNPLPGSMLSFHKQQVENAFNHKGGPPDWADYSISAMLRLGLFLLNRVIYPWLSFRRSRRGLPAYTPPPDWQVRATLMLRNTNGDVLLLPNENSTSWSLPASRFAAEESPWTLAEQLARREIGEGAEINGLSGIYLRKGQPRMEFVFSGDLAQGAGQPQFSGRLFTPESLPAELSPAQGAMISDALQPDHQVAYGLLDGT
jgi:ADP-ribose pyrophosphatase YjhB (NUDIX family)